MGYARASDVLLPVMTEDETREKRFVQDFLRFAVRRFVVGPFERRSASSSDARSMVTDSTESPARRLAFVSPSVT